VDAAKGEKAAAEAQLARAKKLVESSNGAVEERDAAAAVVRKLEAVVRAAQAKLKAAEEERPDLAIDLARANVAEKQTLVQKAQGAVDECRVTAPEDGEVLRVLTGKGDVLSPQAKAPALQFCPNRPRIVRAEVQQEWAARVKVGQEAVVEDYTATALRWTGRVRRLSDWYTHRRSIIQEPFQFNDVRTLECLVDITGPGPGPLRIGQRMRVIIK
jgi:multidrug resistance efflux pump